MNLKRLLLENYGIKLAALVMALALWFYVTSKGRTEVTVTAPLELRNIPHSMAVIGDVPKNVEVRLQGQERALRNITWDKKVVAVANLSRAAIGENILRLSHDDIRRPSGIAVTHINPYEIKVRLEPITRKSIRLYARLRGKPADGYKISGFSATPSRVTVEGPKSVVDSIAFLRTMPIDITGARKNITLEQPRIDYGGKPVRIIEKDIILRIFIEASEKTIK